MTFHTIFAHPEPKSFNGQLADATDVVASTLGRTSTRSDLYSSGFDPRLGPEHFDIRAVPETFHPQTEQRASAEAGRISDDLQEEIDRLLACDLLIVHFPLWWFGPPAILKGWMDRVFVYGHVYRSTMRYDTGIARGKKMIACVTTGASAANCAPNGREGDTRLHLWPILYPFRYLGFEVVEPHIIHGVGSTAFMEGNEAGQSGLEHHLSEWRNVLSGYEARALVPYNPDSDFDESKQLRPQAPSHSPFIRQAPGRRA